MDTKSVILLLDSLPIGLKTNIAAILGMSLGCHRPDLVGGAATTADGRQLPGITTLALPILSADETVLSSIFLKTCNLELLVAFGTAALTTKNYAEYRSKLGALTDEDQGIKGLLLCGSKKIVNGLVGQLSLLRLNMNPFETRWPGMVLLQTTGFTRGSAMFPNEGPVRRVSLSPYLIDRLPVTNAQFACFVTEGGYRTPHFWTENGWHFAQDRGLRAPNYWDDPNWNAPDLPVTGISWWEARAYAAFVGKKLPTEAQWEYAAGFGERTYPWGEEPPTYAHANFAPDCEPSELRRRGTPVEGLPSNFAVSGCRDMAGNVGEWCLDNASNSYEWDCGAPDPLFSTRDEDAHILRGGSGLHDQDALRCASRDNYTPALRDNITGLRCVVWPVETFA